MHEEQAEPTTEEVGRFIPKSQLLQWHKKMQQRLPQIFTPDDKLFGTQGRQHELGTKLMTFFDDDPNKPMHCEVVGSRWKIEYGEREPVYVVLIGNELSQIPLTSAHEEGGWVVDKSASSNPGSEDEDEYSDDEYNSCEEEEAGDDVAVDAPNEKSEQTYSHECIECDAECGKSNPEKRCSKCLTVYYCDTNCQRLHWNEHKPYCMDINEMRKGVVGISAAPTEQDVKCEICLKDKALNPVVISGCKHAFCFSCHDKWKGVSSSNSKPGTCTSSCPYCRTNSSANNDSREQKLNRAYLNATRASTNKCLDRRYEYCDYALYDINAILSDNENDMQALFKKVEILNIDGRSPKAKEAIEVAKEIVSINETRMENSDRIDALYPQVQHAMAIGDEDEEERLLTIVGEEMAKEKARGTNIPWIADPFSVPLLLADTYIKAGEWSEAENVFKGILIKMESPDIGSPPQHRQVWMGLCRCSYELGNYEMAQNAGEAAVQMNRHFPGVHKYIALAQKESGDLDAAIATMNRAVLYEAPWDAQHMSETKRLFKELKSSNN